MATNTTHNYFAGAPSPADKGIKMTCNTIFNDLREILAARDVSCNLATLENGDIFAAVIILPGLGSPRLIIEENVMQLWKNGNPCKVLAAFDEWPTRGGVEFTAVNVAMAITCYLAGWDN